MSELEWMDEIESADWLRVPVEAVKEAIASGRLPALRIGDVVRVSRTALLGAATVLGAGMAGVQADASLRLPGVPLPRGVTWLDDIRPTEAFTRRWPQDKKKYGVGHLDEEYPKAWTARIGLNGIEQAVLIGECARYERGRLSVFMNDYPVQEFMDTPDGGSWAGLIKTNGKKTVATESALPPLYRQVKVLSYQVATGTSGSGHPTGLAVVLGRDDLKSAVHHAAARQLGRQGLLLVSA